MLLFQLQLLLLLLLLLLAPLQLLLLLLLLLLLVSTLHRQAAAPRSGRLSGPRSVWLPRLARRQER
jgi:hypothetical protein